MSFDVIDFHTHPFISAESNFCIYRDVVKNDTDAFLSDMDEAGVSVFCGSVIKRTEGDDFEALKQCNREALRLREIYGERYQAGFHVHPDFVDESVEEIRVAKENDLRIIGELVPYMNGWTDYTCKGFSDILDEVEKHGMVVSVHSMDLGQMTRMAEAHKNIRFVFAHPGERVNAEGYVETMKRLDNVSLDLSGTGLFRYGLVKYLVNQVGAERIVFGTDYPICNLQMYIHAVLGEKLTDREKECILSANARALLKI